MYYPLYNNPFFYPCGAYMPNVCPYGYSSNSQRLTSNTDTSHKNNSNETSADRQDRTLNEGQAQTNSLRDIFSINGDRIEAFGISINIDDLIILIMLFFLLRESQVDFSIIFILALILFDQS